MNIILLKHGKKYTAQDVNQQAVSLRKYTDYPIYCFTEDPENVIIDCIPIPNKPKLAKWWNKLHAFRPGFGDSFIHGSRCVMFDLDIDIISSPFPSLENINWDVPHFVCDYWKEDKYWETHAYETMLNSSIMTWTVGKNTNYWDIFAKNIDYNTRKYKGMDRYIWDQKLEHGTFENEIHDTIIL
jgi:hypothetical protein